MTQSHTNTTIDTTPTVLSKDGARISYLSMGSGPSVLVIPGALSMAAGYAAFARALAEHFPTGYATRFQQASRKGRVCSCDLLSGRREEGVKEGKRETKIDRIWQKV
jgi:hypothetical protein